MQTETRKIAPSLPPAARVRPLAAVRRFVGRWGQIAALAALPACYGVHDLVYGYQAGAVAGHPLIRHDLSMLGFNFAFAVGLSNGTIWALIAIGYTLVYGIIDLINFAARRRRPWRFDRSWSATGRRASQALLGMRPGVPRGDGPATSMIMNCSERWKRNASSMNLSWVGLIWSGPAFASANLTWRVPTGGMHRRSRGAFCRSRIAILLKPARPTSVRRSRRVS